MGVLDEERIATLTNDDSVIHWRGESECLSRGIVFDLQGVGIHGLTLNGVVLQKDCSTTFSG
ncbi:hypothetical protein WS1165 [Wolinella succinogenes]|uniref:Uncharacterized protein n=1 Tax=Wolinella succinogenes (strain ATCC 29543 / DSM 1740 / CCUG 13145 / JCM 31913 / LMG 7466 / NCTC 11488 / FDC 602W) TaxID=273121 RepID=Q7MRN6_WOLSU|nr:hypothetical protein WS1165 [Wolinella succinogenes]